MSDIEHSLRQKVTLFHRSSYFEKVASSLFKRLHGLEETYQQRLDSRGYETLRGLGLPPQRADDLRDFLLERPGPAGLAAGVVDRIYVLAQQERIRRRLGLPLWTPDQTVANAINKIQIVLLKMT